MDYLFLKPDRINCYSFFNEISKRNVVFSIYIFGWFRSPYHGDGVLPTLCADRLPEAKHLFSLIHFSILRFQQELVMNPFDLPLVIFCTYTRPRLCVQGCHQEHSGSASENDDETICGDTFRR